MYMYYSTARRNEPGCGDPLEDPLEDPLPTPCRPQAIGAPPSRKLLCVDVHARALRHATAILSARHPKRNGGCICLNHAGRSSLTCAALHISLCNRGSAGGRQGARGPLEGLPGGPRTPGSFRRAYCELANLSIS